MRKVTVIGAGALGSHLVQFLRTTPVQINVIDFDRVEAKNTLSQFHAKTNVGKSKVQSLKGQMSLLFGTNITVVPHELRDGNKDALLQGSDLLIDCTDNGDARRLIQKYSSLRTPTVPCLHGALAADGAFGRVVWMDNFKIDDVSGSGATCEDGAHLPFIGIVSAYLARAAQEFLSTGRRIGFEVNAGGAIRT